MSEREARMAGDEYEEAFASWQGERDVYAQLLDIAKGFEAAAFDSRVDMALAHFRRDVEAFVHDLEAELAEINARRPSQPLLAAAQPPTATPHPRMAQEHAITATAGWYPDPWRQADLRWWDGSEWTGNVHSDSMGTS